MLFKQVHLNGIKDGKVSLAFRRWEKPAVNKGSLLKTAIGMVKVNDIREVQEKDITAGDVRKAGFSSKEELLRSFRPVGRIFKIQVRYHSVDPRIGLRQQTDLTKDEWDVLKQKLDRLDKYSKTGPWTYDVLKAIEKNPLLRAADLAKKSGKTKDWLKPNVRKLKNLGLTISHHPGYELSPRGKKALKLLYR